MRLRRESGGACAECASEGDEARCRGRAPDDDPPYHPAVAFPTVRERFLPADLARRLPRLLLGLAVFGFGIALMSRAGIGLGPWEAFHQGIQFRTGIPMGTVSILLGLPIVALWWPLGQRPGIGTLLNVALIGTATNVGNDLLPAQTQLPLQMAQMLIGVIVIGLGSGLYLATRSEERRVGKECRL